MHTPRTTEQRLRGSVRTQRGGVSEASAAYSHAEGLDSHATGDHSHAEGQSTASGDYSHAEGSSVASASTAHAEGSGTTARGQGAHSGGTSSTANGKDSITHGTGTIAWYDNQATFGILNKNKNNTLLEIGNGTEEANRSNAFEVYKDGHAEVLTQGDTDNSVVTKSGLAAELEAKQDVLNSEGTYSVGELEKISSIGSKDAVYSYLNNKNASYVQAQTKITFKNNKVTPVVSFAGFVHSWTDGGGSKIDLPDGMNLWDDDLRQAWGPLIKDTDVLIKGIANPTEDSCAANKAYVDGLIATLTDRITALETELAALKSGGES